jgi:hypothetical protein
MAQPLQEFIKKIKDRGVPIPMIQDPVTKLPSVTLTFSVLSFNVALLGLLGKVADMFKGIDVQQAIYLFGVSAGLYLGRKMTNGTLSVEKKEENK